MTTLDARLSLETFDMTNGSLVDFMFPVLFSTSDLYAWNTSDGNFVYAYGSGITSDPSTHYPTGGSISLLKLDVEQDGNPATNEAIDAFVTPTSAVPLTDLVSPNGTNAAVAADKFWERLLSGDDQILAPESSRGFLFGDFLQILSDQFTTEVKTGGNDTITAASTLTGGIVSIGGGRSATVGLVGDAYRVEGSEQNNIAYTATLFGGNDTITMTNRPAYNLVGDAFYVGLLGEVVGGADIIRSDTTSSPLGTFGTITLIGDVVNVENGFVRGGADTITASNYPFLTELISGDVFSQVGAAATTIGAADIINGRAGHDYIAGDLAAGGGSVTGGADSIHGGEDTDIIAGDALQAGDDGSFFRGDTIPLLLNLTGGNDTLWGDGGADWMAGDVWELARLASGSTIAGGDDTMRGGDGNDQMWGDVGGGVALNPSAITITGGKDTLYGESGDDELHGGGAIDTLVGGEGNDSLFGDAGEDSLRGGPGSDALNGGADFDTATYSLATSGVTVNLLFPGGNSGEAAGDTYVSVEQVLGTQHNDNLIGDNGDNAFAGLGGNDTFIGRGGADAFNGGNGTDAVSYSTAGAGLKVDFIVAGNNAGDALGDTFVLVENIFGSQNGDTLAGDNNANTISGLNGNDTLRGRGGADVLIGGGAADTFLIQPGTQSDTVNDLFSGVDTIRLLSFAGIGNINQLKAVGTDSGANSSYNLGGGDTLVIIGHHVADLQAGDFLFS